MASLENKIIFMTGATSGFGKVVANHIINEGAILYVLARTKEKGQELLDSIKSKFPDKEANLTILEGDLRSFESTQRACRLLKDKVERIDMIINNAGIWLFDYSETTDHIEETLQVNLISPMLIIHELYDKINKDGTGKILNTSSGLHQGKINFDYIEFKNKFSGFKSYRQSKLGIILVGKMLAKKLADDNIGVYSIHPGMVKTNLAQHAKWLSRNIFMMMASSVEKGARTHIAVIEKPNSQLESGGYYAKSKLTPSTSESCNTETAEKLSQVIKSYLKGVISDSNPVFD